jgi:hypothetical protein
MQTISSASGWIHFYLEYLWVGGFGFVSDTSTWSGDNQFLFLHFFKKSSQDIVWFSILFYSSGTPVGWVPFSGFASKPAQWVGTGGWGVLLSSNIIFLQYSLNKAYYLDRVMPDQFYPAGLWHGSLVYTSTGSSLIYPPVRC